MYLMVGSRGVTRDGRTLQQGKGVTSFLGWKAPYIAHRVTWHRERGTDGTRPHYRSSHGQVGFLSLVEVSISAVPMS